MTIYVDILRTYPGKGDWCHMMSDESLEELHTFADKIGLRRSWFQNIPEHPHYDLRPGTRAKAIKAGAIEATDRQLLLIARYWRMRNFGAISDPEKRIVTNGGTQHIKAKELKKLEVLMPAEDDMSWCSEHRIWYVGNAEQCPVCVCKQEYNDLLNDHLEAIG